MQRLLNIVNMIPLIFLVLLLTCYIKLTNTLQHEFDSEYYELIANRCSDAAAEAMIVGTSSVNTDYTTLFSRGDISVDPDVAVREYGVVLCLSQNMLVNDKNIQSELLDKVKVLSVAAYDGYYMYGAEKDTVVNKTPQYGFVGTPKLPYPYIDGNSCYAVTMASLGKSTDTNPTAVKVAVNGSNVSLKFNEVTPSTMNSTSVRSVINGRIGDEFNYRIKSLYNNGWRGNVFIPNTIGRLATAQPIEGPTVLALLDVGKNIQPFGIGGTRLEVSDRVVGFVSSSGKKYYCWESQTGQSFGNTVTYFESPVAAAKRGYYYYPAFY